MSDLDLSRPAVLYTSPPGKRKLARGIAYVFGVLLVLAVWHSIGDWQMRAEKGYPMNYGSVVMWIGPLGMIAIGLWIGWGQTRVDLLGNRIERRPLGLPWPSRVRPLSAATDLHVGFHRAPSRMHAHQASFDSNPRAYWYVHLRGPGFTIPLIVQRDTRTEALAFAERVAETSGLPVTAVDDPDESP